MQGTSPSQGNRVGDVRTQWIDQVLSTRKGASFQMGDAPVKQMLEFSWHTSDVIPPWWNACPWNVCTHSPVLGFQLRSVPSPEPVTIPATWTTMNAIRPVIVSSVAAASRHICKDSHTKRLTFAVGCEVSTTYSLTVPSKYLSACPKLVSFEQGAEGPCGGSRHMQSRPCSISTPALAPHLSRSTSKL
eukprot:scaffold1243_cov403-Prasinococcus_capsulatus_cf.AAC.36